MTSFDLDISDRDLAAARYITRVQRHLILQFLRKGRELHLTRADVARKLDVDKSTVSRMLNGKSNLTARTISDLCWALDMEPDLVTRDLTPALANAVPAVSVFPPHGVTGPSGGNNPAVFTTRIAGTAPMVRPAISANHAQPDMAAR